MSENPHRDAIRWSPRVQKWKLRQLYQRVAEGIWDEDLIEEVGMILYMRCRDILLVYEAQQNRRVACPVCLNKGKERFLPRTGARDFLIQCPDCGWELVWSRYRRSYQRKQLNPGGAVDGFRQFLKTYEAGRSPKDRMLAIDRVIHEFHFSLKAEPDRPTRSAGVNLISGGLTDVVPFLDKLGNLPLPDQLRQQHERWHALQRGIPLGGLESDKHPTGEKNQRREN